MKIYKETFPIKTQDYCQFIDITDQVQACVKNSGIIDGIVSVHSMHTTLAIRINERETGLIADFKDFASKWVPKDHYYRHNDTSIRTENLVCDPNASDCLNAHSHITHMFMATSEIVPVSEGKLVLGQWQRVFAIELDCGRNREVYMQVMGV